MKKRFSLLAVVSLGFVAYLGCSTEKVEKRDQQPNANLATPVPAPTTSSATDPLGNVPVPKPVSATVPATVPTADDAPAAASVSVRASAVTYYNRIEQIFASRCAPCHYQGEPVKYVKGLAEKTFQGSQPPYLTGYDNVKKYAGIALAVMQAGTMPPANNLEANDVADLQAWISAGKPAGDPASAPKLSLSIKSILDRRCVACHFPGGANDLTTYESASGPLHSRVIYAALNVLKNMPPSKNLTKIEEQTLSDWAAAGGPRDAYDGPTVTK